MANLIFFRPQGLLLFLLYFPCYSRSIVQDSKAGDFFSDFVRRESRVLEVEDDFMGRRLKQEESRSCFVPCRVRIAATHSSFRESSTRLQSGVREELVLRRCLHFAGHVLCCELLLAASTLQLWENPDPIFASHSTASTDKNN